MKSTSSLLSLQKEIFSCKSCSLATTSTQPVIGEGKTGARLFMIAQAPGEQEERQGRMFVGASGKIFRDIITNAGLSWNDFYLTNLIKCRLPHNRQPHRKEITACSGFLIREIDMCQPQIIIPLGFYATRFMYGLLKGKLLHRDEFSQVIGKFHIAQQKGLFPLSHPASVMYQPQLRVGLERTYAKLSVLKVPCRWSGVCPITRFSQQGIIDDYWPLYYCYGDWSICVRYKMEEEGAFHPDSMMPDGSIDTDLQ